MTDAIAREIQAEQNHGRQKYGRGPDDFEHDDKHSDSEWYEMLAGHLETFTTAVGWSDANT